MISVKLKFRPSVNIDKGRFIGVSAYSRTFSPQNNQQVQDFQQRMGRTQRLHHSPHEVIAAL